MSVMKQLRRLRREEAGFSLIELLAVLTILLTVVGTLTVLMVSATKSEVDLTLRVQAQQEARLALERMRRDVHCASATSLAPDTPAALVTLTIPGACPSALGSTTITWCTAASGSGWALYRIPNITTCTTTAAGARKEAEYLTQPTLFTLRNELDKLPRLCTVFPVDVDPTDIGRAYRLKDFLVMRNSPTRGTAGTQTCV
jgi:prepilin-type N-terminal cleavage/methylation domain-containing protein